MKIRALLIVAALANAPLAKAYDTDDYGFPIEKPRLVARASSSSFRPVARPFRFVRTTAPSFARVSVSRPVIAAVTPTQPTRVSSLNATAQQR